MKPSSNNNINIAAIHAAVESGLTKLERDPVRGVRNMLDMGQLFSRTHRQRSFFQMAQRMLGRRRSQYMQLVKRAVANVERNTLKTMGINLGYHSWSQGAKVIRAIEEERGFNVPWSFVIRLNQDCAQPLSAGEVRGTIAQARELGVHCYWLAIDERRDDLDELMDMCGTFNDCAFIIMLPVSMINDSMAQRALSQSNIAICVGGERSDELERATKVLRQARLLYGLYRLYDDTDYQNITGGEMLSTTDMYGGQFAVFMHAPDCSEECRAKVHAYANGEKDAPERPVFMVDFFADLATVDNIISSQPCYIEIESDGEIRPSPRQEPSGVNLRTHTIADAMLELVPRM